MDESGLDCSAKTGLPAEIEEVTLHVDQLQKSTQLTFGIKPGAIPQSQIDALVKGFPFRKGKVSREPLESTPENTAVTVLLEPSKPVPRTQGWYIFRVDKQKSVYEVFMGWYDEDSGEAG